MPIVQKLYDACKKSFSPDGPVSEEALEIVHAVLDEMMPSNVGLEPEAHLSHQWKSYMNCAIDRKGCNSTTHQDPTSIKYLHLHECDCFSIGIFCMPPSSIIPLHNHPGMTVLSKLIYGSLLMRSYDWLSVPEVSDNPSKARPAILVRDCEMAAPCDTTVLHPTSGGNIHYFKALSPCALFDVLSPPYSSKDGRNCSYFQEIHKRDLPDKLNGITTSKGVWLQETQPPENFLVTRGRYKGPLIRH